MTDARAVKQVVCRERAYDDHAVEFRSKPDGTGGEKLTFTGYASVYGHDYPINDRLGTYIETMAPGCFSQTIGDGADVPFLLNHGGMTLARTKSGTLRLDPKDSHGLLTEATLDPRNSAVRDLQSAMERGDVDEMSFSFGTMPDGSVWSTDSDGNERCMRVAVSLHKGDVSAVNYGANPATAGAMMRAADFIAHPELMDEDEQRRMFERLAAKFQKRDDTSPSAFEFLRRQLDLEAS